MNFIETIIVSYKTNKMIKEFDKCSSPQEALVILNKLLGWDYDSSGRTIYGNIVISHAFKTSGTGSDSKVFYHLEISSKHGTDKSQCPMMKLEGELTYLNLSEFHLVVKHIISLIKPFIEVKTKVNSF